MILISACLMLNIYYTFHAWNRKTIYPSEIVLQNILLFAQFLIFFKVLLKQ